MIGRKERDRARDAILALSDERARWRSRLLAAEYEQYARGRADGYRAGRDDCLRELAAAQRKAADHMMPGLLGPADAELVIRRWAPPGWPGPVPAGTDSRTARIRLARMPRKGDYAGGPVAW